MGWCYLTGRSQRGPRIFIFSIVLGAECLSYRPGMDFVVRDLACHVISLNAGCLWVTPSAIPGLHRSYWKHSKAKFFQQVLNSQEDEKKTVSREPKSTGKFNHCKNCIIKTSANLYWNISITKMPYLSKLHFCQADKKCQRDIRGNTFGSPIIQKSLPICHPPQL